MADGGVDTAKAVPPAVVASICNLAPNDARVVPRGRAHARWRADGNGIVHGIQADLQSDPLDRVPQAPFALDPAVARRFGTTLGRTVLPRVDVGPLRLDPASALTVPLGIDGILGLDFFFGHVVEIDYRRQRVRVLCAADAQAAFADPKTSVIDANVDQGLPLVHAAFDAADGDTFAIDTGSPRLYVMRPFVLRNAADIAAHWTKDGPSFVEEYLEGGIEVQPYRVAEFRLANVRMRVVSVAQVPTKRTDDLAIPFDGIIGTDVLGAFDLYFDYDNGRLGVRL